MSDIFDAAMELAERHVTAKDDALDDEVTETACAIAAGVNNSGLQGQILYLLSNGYTADAVESLLTRAES